MSSDLRRRWRLKRFQLTDALGLGQRGWFIPYRYRSSSPVPTTAYPEHAFRAARSAMLATMADAARYAREWGRFAGRPAPPTPRFDQDWFPGLDAALLYGVVRVRRPARIVEVGSGHSTRFAARAVLDAALQTEFIAIDPQPRAAIEALAPTVDFRRATIQDIDLVLFDRLRSGDILFIDSSHILMPGSDVDILFNRVLPRLAAGVLVHIHDVFLPDPYPPEWEWRGYNEQNVAAALIEGGGYRLIAASRFIETRMRAAYARDFAALPPSPPGAMASSLWLEKRVAPPGGE